MCPLVSQRKHVLFALCLKKKKKKFYFLCQKNISYYIQIVLGVQTVLKYLTPRLEIKIAFMIIIFLNITFLFSSSESTKIRVACTGLPERFNATEIYIPASLNFQKSLLPRSL